MHRPSTHPTPLVPEAVRTGRARPPGRQPGRLTRRRSRSLAVAAASVLAIGVAQAAGPDRLDAAVREADAALYEAKNGGRNQVRPADPGVAAVRGDAHGHPQHEPDAYG